MLLYFSYIILIFNKKVYFILIIELLINLKLIIIFICILCLLPKGWGFVQQLILYCIVLYCILI